jgi:hypothetical protein
MASRLQLCVLQPRPQLSNATEQQHRIIKDIFYLPFFIMKNADKASKCCQNNFEAKNVARIVFILS